LLKLPLFGRSGHDFPIVQYADDTLLIMESCPRQLFFLKSNSKLFFLNQLA
jgi:hypothetical protein